MKTLTATALSHMKKAGADHAQSRITKLENREISMDSGKIALMRTAFNTVVSLTAMCGKKRGALVINQSDSSSIEDACIQVVEASKSAQSDEANYISAPESGPNEYKTGCDTGDINRLYDRLEEFLDTVHSKTPSIKIDGHCSYVSSLSRYDNTNGVFYDIRNNNYQISFLFSAKEGSVSTSFNYMSAALKDLDVPFWEVGGIGTLLEQTVQELSAKPLRDKFAGDIILAPYCVTDFLEMYIGTFLSDTPMISGTSVLKGKQGEKVACERVNLSSNPTDSRYCGYHVMDDGYRARDMVIIENGVLKNYCLSQYGANRIGCERSPNVGDMAFISPGESLFGDMIKNVKKGLVVGRFSGGHPNENGDFSGIAKNAFYVENGKLLYPVSETMIAGNVRDMLSNVQEISKETLSNGSISQPWLRVSNVIISG